mgnify:CR=1 FL=1
MEKNSNKENNNAILTEISETVPLLFQKSTETSEIEDLYSYLYKDKPWVYDKSKDNLDELIQLYERSSVVSFTGAGASKPLGISDWEELMTNLWNKAKSNGFNNDFPKDSKEWPKLAQEIWEHLKNNEKKKIYFDTISQSMSPRNNTTTLTLIKLVLALDIHLTTNFDISIENAYKFLDYLAQHFNKEEIRKKYQVYYLPDFQIIQGTEAQGTIYYLHGGTTKSVYVLKENDYDAFYPSVSGSSTTDPANYRLENLLRTFYKERTIVFLGFSFNDPYVRKFFFRLSKETAMDTKVAHQLYDQSGQPYEPQPVRHFLIIDAEILEKRRDIVNVFEENNIYMIVYKTGQHIFLEKFFETLSKGKSI